MTLNDLYRSVFTGLFPNQASNEAFIKFSNEEKSDNEVQAEVKDFLIGKKAEAARINTMLMFCLFFIVRDIISNEGTIRAFKSSIKKISDLIELGKDVSVSDLERVFNNKLSKYTIRQKLKEKEIIADEKKSNSKFKISPEQLKKIKKILFNEPSFFGINPDEDNTIEFSINIKEGIVKRILKEMRDYCFEEQALFIHGKNLDQIPKSSSVDAEIEKQEGMILTVKKLQFLSDRLEEYFKNNSGTFSIKLETFLEEILSKPIIVENEKTKDRAMKNLIKEQTDLIEKEIAD